MEVSGYLLGIVSHHRQHRHCHDHHHLGIFEERQGYCGVKRAGQGLSAPALLEASTSLPVRVTSWQCWPNLSPSGLWYYSSPSSGLRDLGRAALLPASEEHSVPSLLLCHHVPSGLLAMPPLGMNPSGVAGLALGSERANCFRLET